MKHKMSKFAAAVVLGVVSLCAQAANPPASHTDITTVPVSFPSGSTAFSYNYGNTFTGTGHFHDFYEITTPAATFNSITATFSLGNLSGIDNLTSRLLTGSASTFQAAQAFQNSSDPAVAVSYAGSGNVVNGWSTTLGVGSSINVIPSTFIPATTYTFEVWGNVVGSSGGSYGGAFNLALGDVAAVPEPEGYALMLSGLAMIGGMVFRRRKMI